VPAIKKGHRLIREGPYSYVRHPIYLSSFIVIMGFIMISKSIFSLVYCIFICIPYGLYKISLEEEILEKRFGKSFRTYKKNTPMILPTLKSFNREK